MRILQQVRAKIGQAQGRVFHLLLAHAPEVENTITEQWESSASAHTQPGDYRLDESYLAALAYALTESEGVTPEWAIKELGGLHSLSGGLKSMLWGDEMKQKGLFRYSRLLDLGLIVEEAGRIEFTDILIRHYWAGKHYATFWFDKKNERTFTPEGAHFGKLDPVWMAYLGQLAGSNPEKCVTVFRNFIIRDPHFALACTVNGFAHGQTEVVAGLLDSITWEKDGVYLLAAGKQFEEISSLSAPALEQALVDDSQHPAALLFAAQMLGTVGTADQIPRLVPVLENSDLASREIRHIATRIAQLEAEKMSEEEFKALKAVKIAGTVAKILFHATMSRGATTVMHSTQARIARQKQIRRELEELAAKLVEETSRRENILPQIRDMLRKSLDRIETRFSVPAAL